ncbi:MAG: hypothetical protein ACHQNA_08490 [Acidimicrobiales bacterium]
MERAIGRRVWWALAVLLAGVAAVGVASPFAFGAGRVHAGAARAAALPKVAVYYADFPGNAADVVSKLTASGQFSQVDNLSPLCCGSDPTPSLATLQQYAAVLVWSNFAFNNPVALGDVLADYVDGGGHVVLATFAFHNGGGLGVGGRLVSGGYLPLTQGGDTSGPQAFLVADLPAHPLLAGVSSFDGGPYSLHNSGLAPTSGATLVAHWSSDSEPLVACKGAVVALNFYPSSSDRSSGWWNSATDGVRLMTNALNLPSCIPTGTITVTKKLAPASDPGRFNLRIDGTTQASNVGNTGTTGQVTVPAGDHTVSETAGTNAVLGKYVTTIACSDGSKGHGTSLSGVHGNAGADVTCTITNTRKLYKV